MRVTGPRATLAMAAMLIACALFLFIDRMTLPIVLWDESRNVVNALEMRAQGWSLVTTYGGAPDLWNTKPPLLIWAMWASTGMLGASEWTLRLPSMLAALATLWLVMRHVMRATGSAATALLAAALLTLSPALFGEHSARTADYDALLTLFTTAYCCLTFEALRRGRVRTITLALAGLTVAGAVLTKSVAGLLPGIGLAAFALATGRWRRVVGDRRYWLAALAAAGPVLAFAIAREAVLPGWLAAAWRNDLGGRFAAAVVGVERPWSFYLTDLAAGYFAAPLLLLAAPLAWPAMRPRERLAAGHAAAIVAAMLVVASIAATKLHHYILPAMPFMAVLAAIVACALLRLLAKRKSPVAAVAIALVLGFTAFSAVRGAIVRRYLAPQVGEGARAGNYGALLEALSPRPVTVIEQGFGNEDEADYAPVLRAYQLLAAARGQTVRRSDDLGPMGGITASCDKYVAPQLARYHRPVARVPGCVAVER